MAAVSLVPGVLLLLPSSGSLRIVEERVEDRVQNQALRTGMFVKGETEIKPAEV